MTARLAAGTAASLRHSADRPPARPVDGAWRLDRCPGQPVRCLPFPKIAAGIGGRRTTRSVAAIHPREPGRGDRHFGDAGR